MALQTAIKSPTGARSVALQGTEMVHGTRTGVRSFAPRGRAAARVPNESFHEVQTAIIKSLFGADGKVIARVPNESFHEIQFAVFCNDGAAGNNYVEEITPPPIFIGAVRYNPNQVDSRDRTPPAVLVRQQAAVGPPKPAVKQPLFARRVGRQPQPIPPAILKSFKTPPSAQGVPTALERKTTGLGLRILPTVVGPQGGIPVTGGAVVPPPPGLPIVKAPAGGAVVSRIGAPVGSGFHDAIVAPANGRVVARVTAIREAVRSPATGRPISGGTLIVPPGAKTAIHLQRYGRPVTGGVAPVAFQVHAAIVAPSAGVAVARIGTQPAGATRIAIKPPLSPKVAESAAFVPPIGFAHPIIRAPISGRPIALAIPLPVPPPPPAPPPPPPGPLDLLWPAPDNFPLDAYRFLIFEIRRMDLFGSPRPGTLFFKRYFQGINNVWGTIAGGILNLPTLWDVLNVPDRFLKFLKWIVGWTDAEQLKKITDSIDDASLRRLISASGRLWKSRGPEDAILDVLRLLTRARLRIWNWFDFRWVLDETGLGEEHEGRDPWAIYLPKSVQAERQIDQGAFTSSIDGANIILGIGTFSTTVERGMIFRVKSGPLNGQQAAILVEGPHTLQLEGAGLGVAFGVADWEIIDQDFAPDDEYRSNLRIADDGTLDRTLTKRILRLMRATGERWDITYLALLDLFDVEGDDLQWQPLAGASNVPVANGLMTLDGTAAAVDTFAIVSNASWSDLVLSARIKATVVAGPDEIVLRTRRSSDTTPTPSDYVELAIRPKDGGGELELRTRIASGAVVSVATVSLAAIDFPFLEDVFYTVRMTVQQAGASARVQVHIDGALLLDSPTFVAPGAGTVGFLAGTGAILAVSEVEVFELPVDNDSLELNETP